MAAEMDTTADAPAELGEVAQRRLAIGFTAAIAVLATALLVLAPALIPGQRDATPFHQSPTMFPMAALAIVALCAAWHVLHLLRGAALDNDDIDEPTANWRVVVLAFVAYAGYVVAVPKLGYAPATVLFVCGLGALAGMGWRRPLAIGLVLSAALFVVFVLALKVWFPSASLY